MIVALAQSGSVPSFPVTSMVQLGTLLLARIIPIVSFTPLFGGEAVPRRFRLGVSVLLASSLALAMGPPAAPLAAPTFVMLLTKEVLVGATIALVVIVLFQTLAAAGAFVDLARGATLANVLDPLSRQQTPILASFLLQLGVVTFLTLGGYALLLQALAGTIITLPPAAPAPVTLLTEPTTGRLIGLVGELFAHGIRIAAPIIVVVFVLDVALGLINRAAPQIQVFFLGMTVKGWLGVLVLMASLHVSLDLIIELFRGLAPRVAEWIR